MQGAWAAARAKEAYQRVQFLRLTSRRGPKKAAVATSMLMGGYHMLRDQAAYRDLGPDHFSRRDGARVAERLPRRLRDLGYDVRIQKAS